MLNATQLLDKQKESQYQRIMDRAKDAVAYVQQQMTQKTIGARSANFSFSDEIMDEPFEWARKELGKSGYKLGRLKDRKKLFISW